MSEIGPIAGENIASGVIGAISAWAAVWITRLKGRNSVEARFDRWRSEMHREQRAEIEQFRARLRALEGNEVLIKQLRVVVHMLVAEVQRLEPKSLLLMQVRAILGDAYPVEAVPPDMSDTLRELHTHETDGGDAPTDRTPADRAGGDDRGGKGRLGGDR